jgi:regulatory protein
LSDQTIETTAVTATDIRRAAMDLLARRDHSFRELVDKLAHRFGTATQTASLIQSEVERLRDERLQSDERFAEGYLHSRAQRLYGPLRIKAELRERGISDTVIAALLKASDIDWQQNLQRLADSRFGLRPAADFKEKAKRMRFLQYRGFHVEDIGAAAL